MEAEPQLAAEAAVQSSPEHRQQPCAHERDTCNDSATAARLDRVATLRAAGADQAHSADAPEPAMPANAQAPDGVLLEEDWPVHPSQGNLSLGTHSVELEGKDAIELYNCGLDYQDAGDHTRAIECFTAALEHGNDSDTLVARGNSLLESGEWAAAIVEYTAALRCEPLDLFRHATQRLVELDALTSEGIFRLAGSNAAVTSMMDQLQDGLPPRKVLRGCHEVDDVATFLGRWLREQPMLIPATSFVESEELLIANADAAMCETFVASLPEPGQGLLRALVGFLQRVDAETARMTPDNLSRVFALTVFKRDDPMDMMKHVASDAAFISLLIQRLPPSWWSHSDTATTVGDPDTDEDEDDEEVQSIFYSRGVAALELAVFNRRSGLGGGGSNELDSALADLKRATAFNPEDPDAWAYLARAHSAAGDHTGAVLANEQALALDTGEASAVRKNLERAKQRVRNAELASAADVEEKLRLLRGAVQDHPDDLESLLQCGELLLELDARVGRRQWVGEQQEEQHKEVASCAQSAMALAPADTRPSMLCAQLCMKCCDWDGARGHYSSVLSLAGVAEPAVPQIEAAATAGLGLACYRQGSHEYAVTLFTKAEALYRAASLEPERSLLLNRGSARQRLGDLAGAYEDFDTALTIDQEYAAAYLARGMVMAALQQEDAADSDYSAALACAQKKAVQQPMGAVPTAVTDIATNGIWWTEHDVFAKALRCRGDLRAKRGCNTDAVADYSSLLNLMESAPPGPVDHQRVLLARGHALCDMGSYSAAQTDFLAAIDKTGDEDDSLLLQLVHTALGNVYQLQGDYIKATESFAKAAVLAEKVETENGITPGGADSNAEFLRNASTHSQRVSNAATPAQGLALVAPAGVSQLSTNDVVCVSDFSVVDDVSHKSLRQLLAQLCRPSSPLISWQYADKLTNDPAAKRAQYDREAFLLGYPSAVSAATVLRQLYELYTRGPGDTVVGSTGRVVQASEQLCVLQLLHAWLDPVRGFPEDLLGDGTDRCTADVVAAEAELQRIIVVVESATDDTALLVQQVDGVSIPRIPVEPNGGPGAAEALRAAIENATVGGTLPRTRRARMLGMPRIFGDRGKQLAGDGRKDTTPPPMINSSWSTEQWGQSQLWLDISPEEIARQLCRMDQRVYCAISPRHLLALNWTARDTLDAEHRRQTTGTILTSATVTRALSHHANLVDAVRGSLLSSELSAATRSDIVYV
eukprot:COSAG02_NODE_5133_length_4601_cov_5.407152_1_plen_1219_part_00